ncbi:MAG: hypothetical protein QOJ70_2842 [Acidobacteriota bacterium]|jgi:hypothetical protein|nr:hypothetical protein [Acidobacteriota bacterium]
MRLLHLCVGAAVLVAFLLTGQYMDYLNVRSGALGEVARAMFRSRHIYLLLAGLVNLGVGSYFSYRERGWRRTLQVFGSVLIVVAPALMLAAFFTEPGLPGLKRHFTLPAVIILSVGTLLHALSGLRFGSGLRSGVRTD